MQLRNEEKLRWEGISGGLTPCSKEGECQHLWWRLCLIHLNFAQWGRQKYLEIHFNFKFDKGLFL